MQDLPGLVSAGGSRLLAASSSHIPRPPASLKAGGLGIVRELAEGFLP
jgi:hypothetical protein